MNTIGVFVLAMSIMIGNMSSTAVATQTSNACPAIICGPNHTRILVTGERTNLTPGAYEPGLCTPGIC